MVEWDFVIYSVPFLAVVVVVLLASMKDPTVRRAVAIVRKDGHIERHMVGRRNYIREGGAWWYRFSGVRYAARGPYYTFSYRMVRSLGLRSYLGIQRIYMEGNPTPYQFDEDKQIAALRDTATVLGNAVDSDLPTRLLRPRRMDLGILLLVGALALVIGVVIGGRVT